MSQGMKTWQVKEKFTLRVTATSKCPLVEILKPEYVGKANLFVSHAYSYDLEDSIEVMLRYEETHPGSVYWSTRSPSTSIQRRLAQSRPSS